MRLPLMLMALVASALRPSNPSARASSRLAGLRPLVARRGRPRHAAAALARRSRGRHGAGEPGRDRVRALLRAAPADFPREAAGGFCDGPRGPARLLISRRIGFDFRLAGVPAAHRAGPHHSKAGRRHGLRVPLRSVRIPPRPPRVGGLRAHHRRGARRAAARRCVAGRRGAGRARRRCRRCWRRCWGVT